MKFKLSALASLMLCTGAGVQAQSLVDNPSVTFSGFGTVGLNKTTTDEAEFTTVGVPGGAKKTVTAKTDSKLGLQANARLNNAVSGTVQILTKHNTDGNFKPEVEWAFAKAQMTPALAVRLGRIGAPLFMISDFRDVGYSNLWVRPPKDVYDQVTFSHFNGADVLYQVPIGATTVTAQAFYGSSISRYNGIRLDFKDVVGVNLTAELDDGLSIRLGTATAKLNLYNQSINGLLATLRATPFKSVANEMDTTGKSAEFTGLGVNYDKDEWTASAEITRRTTGSYIADTTGWQLTLGRHFGKWTPYATTSRLKVAHENVTNTVPKVGAQLTALSTGVDMAIASQYTQERTNSLGVRWDAIRNVAVKAQFDRIAPDHSRGTFQNPDSSFGTKPVNVYSLNVDFVF